MYPQSKSCSHFRIRRESSADNCMRVVISRVVFQELISRRADACAWILPKLRRVLRFVSVFLVGLSSDCKNSSCLPIKMSRNSLLFKQPGGATPGLKHAAEKREEVADSLSVFHSSRALNGALLGATDAASCESYWLRPRHAPGAAACSRRAAG